LIIAKEKKMPDTTTIMEKGMDVLLKNLGVIDTEEFISTISRRSFDYTEWSREYFANYDPEQFLKDAVDYDKNNPVV
jgi:hypothetical protein